MVISYLFTYPHPPPAQGTLSKGYLFLYPPLPHPWSRNTCTLPKYPCIQMHICVRTFNALFSPGHRWLTSSIVLSKDLWSIVYRVQGTQRPGVIVLHSKDVVRLDWGQTARAAEADKLPGNCNNLWFLTGHNKHVWHVTYMGGHWTTTVCLSV